MLIADVSGATALLPAPLPLYAYVTNQGSETVSIVDLARMVTLDTIKVPGKPAGVALSPQLDQLYVTAPDAHDIAVIDLATGTVARRIPIGGGPLGIAVSPVNGLVYVADWYSRRLVEVDPKSGAITAEFEVGQSPSGIAITPDGKFALTADRESDTVSIVDVSHSPQSDPNPRATSIKVGSRPFGITLTGDRYAYTANVGSDDVSIVDVAKRAVIATVPVGRRPYAVALSQDRAFVSDQYGGTVTVFDLATNLKVATIPVGDHPEGIAYDGYGAVYVACWFDNTLVRIDAATLKVTGKVEVGDGPRAFGTFLGLYRPEGASAR